MPLDKMQRNTISNPVKSWDVEWLIPKIVASVPVQKVFLIVLIAGKKS